MEIYKDAPEFRPITIRIETQDELDQLFAIIDNVAENRLNHIPPIITAAKVILRNLTKCIESE